MLTVTYYELVETVTVINGEVLSQNKRNEKQMIINPDYIVAIKPHEKSITVVEEGLLYLSNESFQTIYNHFVEDVYAQ